MTTAKTTGQTFATALRRTHHINTRTRWSRDGYSRIEGTHNLRTEMTQTILDAGQHPEWFGDDGEALRAGFNPILGWMKHVGHVDGGRVDAVQAAALRQLGPYRWIALLAEMVDAGITNTGEAELWFTRKRAEHRELYRELFAA